MRGTAGIGISVTADAVVVRGGTVADRPAGICPGTPWDEAEHAGGFELPDPDDDTPAPRCPGTGLGLQVLEGGPVHVEASLVRLDGTAAACSEGLVEIGDAVVADNGGGFDAFVGGGSSVGRSVFARNDAHISSEGFPDQLPEVGCTVFLGGGSAPDFPGPCF